MTLDQLRERHSGRNWEIGHDPAGGQYYAILPHWGALYGQTPGELARHLREIAGFDSYPDVSGAVSTPHPGATSPIEGGRMRRVISRTEYLSAPRDAR